MRVKASSNSRTAPRTGGSTLPQFKNSGTDLFGKISCCKGASNRVCRTFVKQAGTSCNTIGPIVRRRTRQGVTVRDERGLGGHFVERAQAVLKLSHKQVEKCLAVTRGYSRKRSFVNERCLGVTPNASTRDRQIQSGYER